MTTWPSILVVLLLVFPATASSQSRPPRTTFAGVPTVKISEGGLERAVQKVDGSAAANLACVISEIGGDYYWASRDNTPLVRIDGPAFVTYVAATGAGSIRVTKSEAREAASLMGPTEQTYDYVERIWIGLRSVTYYGNVR